MIIKHRGIYRDRFDTPCGVGTMLFALDCYGMCDGCHHQGMRDLPIYEDDADNILNEIQSNKFCGNVLVLGGFEWLDYQYDECLYLIEHAISRGMEVILYTRRDEDILRDECPELFNLSGLYIKVGEYDNSKLSHTHQSYGVPLASTNQYIIRVGEDG